MAKVLVSMPNVMPVLLAMSPRSAIVRFLGGSVPAIRQNDPAGEGGLESISLAA